MKPRCLTFLLLSLPSLALAGFIAARTPNLKKEIIDRLRDPAKRMAAIFEIEERTDYRKWTDNERIEITSGISDPRFTICPARNSNEVPLYLVSYQVKVPPRERARARLTDPSAAKDTASVKPSSADAKKEPSPALPPQQALSTADENQGLWAPPSTPLRKRRLVFLTPEGRVVLPLGAPHYMDTGWVCDFNKDGVLDSTQTLAWAVDQSGTKWIEEAQIVTLENSPHIALRVVFNSEMLTDQWDFEMLDLNNDGILEACFGPASKVRGVLASCEVVYRWNDAKKEWAGPDGSKDDRFWRYRGRDEEFSAWVTQLTKHGGLSNKNPSHREPVGLPPRVPSTPADK